MKSKVSYCKSLHNSQNSLQAYIHKHGESAKLEIKCGKFNVVRNCNGGEINIQLDH